MINRTQFTIEPGKPTVVIRRVFDAPPHLVFDASTKPEYVTRWWGFRASTLTECRIDLRPGGAARLRWDEGPEQELTIERVEKPRVFGFTWQIYGLPADDPRRTYVEFTLEPAGPKPRKVLLEVFVA